MFMQCGRWNFEGQPPIPSLLEAFFRSIGYPADDSTTVYANEGVTIICKAFQATKECVLTTQPFISRSGAMVVWDGRLDNRDELRNMLGRLPPEVPDISIVAAAYDEWKESSFSQLLGDWALAIWNPAKQTLVLAKDFIGLKPLYYLRENTGISWSSLLDPLVLHGEASRTLDEEYIAGWFSSFPAAHRTPFREVQSVPPGAFVTVTRTRTRVHTYRCFDPANRIRYRTDAEYEEHFRAVFQRAVRRRLRGDGSVLAELSGGMDSSAIVCTADVLLAKGRGKEPRLDTLSYFDESEATWNERPFLEKVEQQRGRTGVHIDATQRSVFPSDWPRQPFFPTPGLLLRQTELAKTIDQATRESGARVVLSGLGGDEATGGAPIPEPELADLLVRWKIPSFINRSLVWALAQKRPVHHIWGDVITNFLPLGGSLDKPSWPRWLGSRFVNDNLAALRGYRQRLHFWGPRPSVQACLATIEVLQRQIAAQLDARCPYEKRYPFLDRELWAFVMAIPREQLLRPRERRSLMRRALAGVVPFEILNRTRKAFVARRFLSALFENGAVSTKLAASERFGIVDPDSFRLALETARHGKTPSALPFIRTLLIDAWLENAMANMNLRVPELHSQPRRAVSSPSSFHSEPSLVHK